MILGDQSRRRFLRMSLAAGASAIAGGCSQANRSESAAEKPSREKAEEKGKELTAVEDLMREHGVLRRSLLVYAESAVKLRADPSSVVLSALQKNAVLFRSFGEQYHEKLLEEEHIFPALKKAGGPVSAISDILIAQHQRGREITDFVLAVTARTKLRAADAGPLAQAFDDLVRMYQHHAAIEDTVVFPAWKATLSEDQIDELNEKFEATEHQMFGQDGFEDAVRQIAEIEESLGLADLSQFTPPAPPKL